MASLTQEQANQIFQASTFEEKKALAVDFGIPEDLINEALGEGTIQRLSQRGSEGSNAVAQPAPDLSPEAQEIPFDEGDDPLPEVVGNVGEDAAEDTSDQPVDYENAEEISIDPPEKDLDNLRLVQAATIQNYLDETPLMLSYLQQRGVRDKKNLRDTLVDVKKHEDLQAVRQLFLEQPGISPEEIMTEAQVADLMRLQIEEEADGPKRTANAYADALAQGRIDEAAERQLATNAYLFETFVRPMAENVGFWDQTKQVFWDVLPGSQVLENKAVTDQFFGAKEKIQNAVARFQTLTPEQKKELFPELRDRLIQEVGKTRAVGILSQFLSPTGEMGFDEFNNAWAAVDAVDAITAWGGLATSVLKAGKSVKAIDALKTAKRESEAADIGATAVIDETGETATGAGISTQTAHNNALPMNMSEIDPEYTQGLSGRIVERINAYHQQNKEVVDGIIGGRSWVREEAPLTPEQAERLALDRVRNRTDIENAEIVNRTEEGFELRYEVRDEQGELIRRERMPIRYNPEADQAWEVPDKGVTRMFLESNTALAGDTNLAKDVNRALRLDTSTPRVASQLLDLQRKALEPVLGGAISRPGRNPFLGARQSLARIDEVMRQGDREGVKYNPVQLRMKGLNEKEIEAYYNLRSLFDSLHVLRDFEVRRDLVKNGFKNIIATNGDNLIGQPYSDPGAARRSLSQIEGPKEFVWIDDTGETKRLDDVDLDEMYEKGYSLVRLREGFNTDEAGKVFFSLNRQDQITDLPQQVLHYKEGYVPRIYERAAYFVKQVNPTRVDGKEVDLSQPKLAISRGADTQTVRIFDNKKEAEEFAQRMQDELPETEKSRFVVLEDREIESQGGGLANERGVGPGGGLYTGPRADEPIPFGPEGVEASTVGTFEALSRNIQNVSNFISRNEMRQYWRQKWIDTARKMGVRAEKFGDIPSGTNKETAAYLNKVKNAIDDWSGVPSDSERWWEAASQRMIDKATGGRFDWTTGTLHNFKHKDPVALARAATFHSLLGWFNPVQLWVQAQGATVALSMNLLRPDRMARALKDTLALSAVDFVSSKELIKRAAQGTDTTANRLSKIKELWDKTGYRDSILNTADHASAIQSHGVGSDALRRLADKGLAFYRGGELFNRRLSFITALDEHARKTGKSLDKFNDDDLRQIMTRANDFMLNLSKANRAQWQRGALGLATQFQQVNTKLLETLFGINKRFTKAERAKILVGQLGLYGIAGVPLGTLGYQAISGLAGVSEDEMIGQSDDVKRTLNGGLTDWVAFNVFGADVDVADRSSIADGVETFLFDMLEDPANAVFALPFTSVVDRAYSAFKHANVLFGPALSEGDIPPASVLAGVARETAKITSTWSQVEKAIHMNRHNQLLDKSGQQLVEKDFNFATEFATAIGFSPKEANITYELEAINRANRRYRTKVAEEVVFLMSQYAKAAGDRPWEEVPEDVRNYYAKAIRSRYALMRNEKEEESLREAVARRIQTGNARHDRAVKEYIKNLGEDAGARFSELFAQIKGRPISVYLENNDGEEEQ